MPAVNALLVSVNGRIAGVLRGVGYADVDSRHRRASSSPRRPCRGCRRARSPCCRSSLPSPPRCPRQLGAAVAAVPRLLTPCPRHLDVPAVAVVPRRRCLRGRRARAPPTRTNVTLRHQVSCRNSTEEAPILRRTHVGVARLGAGSSSARRRAPASIFATSIFCISIIAANARLAPSPPLAMASVRTRGVICHDRPRQPACTRGALSAPPLPTMRVPGGSVLRLIIGGDLKRRTPSLCLKALPPLRPGHITPPSVNSTVSTSPQRPAAREVGRVPDAPRRPCCPERVRRKARPFRVSGIT